MTEESNNYGSLSRVTSLLQSFILLIHDTIKYHQSNTRLTRLLQNDMEYFWRLYRIASLKSDIDKINPQIAFVGRTGTGKSKLINSILGKEILPESITPETPFPIYIEHRSDIANYTVLCFYNDRSAVDTKNLNEDKDVRSWLKTNVFPSVSIQEVRIRSAEFDLLQQIEVSFVDTPGCLGAGSDAESHSRILKEYLKKQNPVVFWLFNPSNLTTEERNEFDSYIRDHFFDMICSKADEWMNDFDFEAFRQRVSDSLMLPEYCEVHAVSAMEVDQSCNDKNYKTPKAFRSYLARTFSTTDFIRSFKHNVPEVVSNIESRIKRDMNNEGYIWAPYSMIDFVNNIGVNPVKQTNEYQTLVSHFQSFCEQVLR